MYSNNILNVQESMAILNTCTKKSLETYCMHHVHYMAVDHIFLDLEENISVSPHDISNKKKCNL